VTIGHGFQRRRSRSICRFYHNTTIQTGENHNKSLLGEPVTWPRFQSFVHLSNTSWIVPLQQPAEPSKIVLGN
jgi:hypothetical protein